MNRSHGLAAMITLVVASAACGSDDESGNGGTTTPPPYDPCVRYCEITVACQPTVSAATSGYAQCSWDDPVDVVSADCNDACSSEHAALGSADAATVDGCIRCFADDVQDSCAPADWTAATNGCDPECDNAVFDDFYASFLAAWDMQMTCS